MEKELIAKILKTNPETIKIFEEYYNVASIKESEDNDNIFTTNSKQASQMIHGQYDTSLISTECLEQLESIKERIVDELLEISSNNLLSDNNENHNTYVTNEELKSFPKLIRPQLTGHLMTISVDGCSYEPLLYYYNEYMKAKNKKVKNNFYSLFRQGLDILDYDPIMYEIIGMNPNSMGFWFPALKTAIEKQTFFKIPETKIVKVPMPILQLTRLDYISLTPTTLSIVDKWAYEAFQLDKDKTYFIKTGTYSSKFDFRNAKVTGAREVLELGEYLLYIHHQANLMAGYNMSKDQTTMAPSIYGVSTTNEWVVREYIEDKENNPCIYHGMPLHTEYRVFVDFDLNIVLAAVPYWDPETMKNRFSKYSDSESADMRHDYVIYCAHEETLMNRYEKNKKIVLTNIRKLIKDIKLRGQWSIDIMQNGDDFYIIDMAVASNSAFKEKIPKLLYRKYKENWLPNITLLTNK